MITAKIAVAIEIAGRVAVTTKANYQPLIVLKNDLLYISNKKTKEGHRECHDKSWNFLSNGPLNCKGLICDFAIQFIGVDCIEPSNLLS